jgi:predicted adenine nucleotide alpha hydrolase (AANH) superfamily ATPase
MNILFHICCSNCTLYPVQLLRSEGHDLKGFWYNPNIHPFEEYKLRLDSLKKLSDAWLIDIFYDEEYKPDEFFSLFTAESVPPPPERCRACYLLRLEKTAARAHDDGFEAFSTSLLISPYQDFDQIADTGKKLADKYNVMFYEKDFRSYFKETMTYAKELGLYRQKYCGCLFSKQERDQAVRAKEISRGGLRNK